MVWAEIGQAVGGLAMSLFKRGDSNSAATALKLNKKLMKYQYNLERESRQTSFQDTRQDLLGAGYNPLIAVGQQSNYTPVSSGVTPTSGLQEGLDVANALSGISSAKSAIDRNKSLNSTDLITALSNKAHNNADIDWITSKTHGQNTENAIRDTYGMQEEQQVLNNLKLSGALTSKQTEKIRHEIGALDSETLLNNARARNVNSATTAQEIKNAPRQEIHKWLQNHPKWRRVYNTLIAIGMDPENAFSQVSNLASTAVTAFVVKGAGAGKAGSSAKGVSNYTPPQYLQTMKRTY